MMTMVNLRCNNNVFIILQKVADIFSTIINEIEKAEGNNVKEEGGCIIS